MSEDDGVSRRDVLKLAAGAVLAGPLARAGAAVAEAAAPAPRFFTPREMALVEELSEMIIPTDAHSPGARAAGVAGWLDARLAEAFLPPQAEWQALWRTGLARVEALSGEMHGAGFLEATPEQRLALLTRMAAQEGAPKAPEEVFFRELKEQTIRGYYTSRIGIHDEMEYKGNTMQQEYAGEDPTD